MEPIKAQRKEKRSAEREEGGGRWEEESESSSLARARVELYDTLFFLRIFSLNLQVKSHALFAALLAFVLPRCLSWMSRADRLSWKRHFIEFDG